MRLWSLHPRYLDAAGLVALWREGLLAKAVLAGQTLGYRHHPQLDRFRAGGDPAGAIDAYLAAVHAEALSRGYAFDPAKLGPASPVPAMTVSEGQLRFEWQHLRSKLAARSPAQLARWAAVAVPDPHPLFTATPGPREPWERGG